MNMSFIRKSLPVLLAATFAGQTAAQAAPWLRVDGQVNFDSTASDSSNYESKLRVQDAELRFELMLREGIKIVVKTELEKQLNGSKVFDDFDIEKFVEEAYIQIQTDKLGLPRAVITVGKQTIAFGQNYTEMPMFKDGLLYNLSKNDEVIGMTIALPVNFMKIVDEVAISLYEAGAGDLRIADEHGASIKLSKQLSDRLKAQVSYMIQENAAGGDNEQRASVGFVFTSKDGSWTVWAEGVMTKANPIVGDTWGATVGGSYKVGPGAVVVEYSYLDGQAHEIAVAYNLPVGRNLVLSPELRHRMDLTGTGTDDTRIGIRARLQFHADTDHGLMPRKN